MTDTTVIFSHGHISSPESLKIQALAPVAAECGYATLAIDYQDLRDEPVARMERLVERIRALENPPVLVGSSLGGWVSMLAAEREPVAGLFLMAPALFLEDRVPDGRVPESYRPQCSHVSVIHGWQDDIIPWQSSLRFAEAGRAALHLLDAGHRLENVLPEIRVLFQRFLE